MTQSNPLDLAKHGDPDAIAALMNRSLQPKGMSAAATVHGDQLEVVLELDANQVPNRQVLTNFVQNGLKSLGLTSIRLVHVIGKQANSDLPVWEERFALPTPVSVGAVSPPPPPPLRLPTRPTPAIALGVNDAATTTSESTDSNGASEAIAHAAPPPIPPLKPEAPFPTDEDTRLLADAGTNAAIAPPADHPSDTQALPPEIANSILTAPSHLYDRIASPVAAPVEEPVPTTQFPSVTDDEETVFGDLELFDVPPDTAANPIDELDSSPHTTVDRPEIFDVPPDAELDPTLPEKHLTVVEPGTEAAKTARRSRFSPGLLLGIIAAAVTGGLAFGIIGYALSVAILNSSRPIPPAPSPTGAASPPSPAATGSPDPQALFQGAVESGDRAVAASQTAQSVDDWTLVKSQLEQAIADLRSLPADDPNTATAQAKITAYETTLATAQQRANQTVPNAPPPTATTTVSGALACTEVTSSPSSPALELTNVRFEATGDTNGGYIVGCVTNHTNQAIASITLNMTRTDAAAPASPNPAQPAAAPTPQAVTETLAVSGLTPNSTVPFRSTTVVPTTTLVTINSITWAAAGAAPQQLPLPAPIQPIR